MQPENPSVYLKMRLFQFSDHHLTQIEAELVVNYFWESVSLLPTFELFQQVWPFQIPVCKQNDPVSWRGRHIT